MLNDIDDFLNEEGANNIDSRVGRGPLPSIGSATSSVSSSSLTTLKSQGYLTVPIKDAGVNSLKSTSYYLVNLIDASPETLEIMDHDVDVVICLEDEIWMKKACNE